MALSLMAVCCVMPADAQARKGSKAKTTHRVSKPAAAAKPLLGTFRVSSPDGSYTVAEINLYEKTIDGFPAVEWNEATGELNEVKGDDPVKVYGYIENRIPGITDTYYIINVESAEGPEPNIWIIGDKWNAEMDPIRVAVDYDSKKGTITLGDWVGGDYFDNVTLKRVK